METLSSLDYIAFLLYILIIAGIGAFFGWFVRDIKNYFKGGNTIPWGIGAISNYMGLFTTFVFVAYAGVAYEHGMVAVTVLWCTVMPCIIAAMFLGKRWLRSGILTPVEYLEARFNISVRQLFSWTGLGMRFLDNMVRLYAMGIFLMAATPLSFLQAIILSGAVITFFTIIGGVWAVVVIDTLQFVILAFAALMLVPLALHEAGGLQNLAQSHPDHFNWLNGPKGQPLWLLAYYVMIILKYNANWVFIQRFYSVRDERASRKLGLLTATLFFIFPVFFLLPAVAAVEILPTLSNPETAYVATATKLLPAGLMGLMLAAMFSANMSSLNSELNVMSGVLTNDVYKRLINPAGNEMHYLWVARLNIVLCGFLIVIGSLFVGQLGGAFEANKLLTGLFAIPIAVPLVFGLISKKPRPVGAVATLLVGIVTGLALNMVPKIRWEYATLTEIGVCFAVFYVSGLFRSKNIHYLDRINGFFRKLNTAIPESQKPPVDKKFTRSLMTLFTIALSFTGILFIFMSIPSASEFSGKMAIAEGTVCLLIALLLYIIKRNAQSKNRVHE